MLYVGLGHFLTFLCAKKSVHRLLLGNKNKNFVFCFVFRSVCTTFAPKLEKLW